MISDISIKQETIIEAAMRRFSHFGVNKTTLSEIARDLNISKTSLFYYFDDKEALIIAVFEKLVNDFLTSYNEKITSHTTAEEALLLFIDTKQESLKNNMQLALQAGSIQIDRSSPRLLKLIVKAQNAFNSKIVELLEKGIKEDRLQRMDSRKVAQIIVDTIQSHEVCLKHSLPFPTEKDFDELAQKQKDAVRLFFSGLKNRQHENN